MSIEDAIIGLKAARERVARPGGWIQKSYYDGWKSGAVAAKDGISANAAVCAVGACIVVGKMSLASLLGATLQERGYPGSTFDFNDAEGRTQEEVVELFDATIRWLEMKL